MNLIEYTETCSEFTDKQTDIEEISSYETIVSNKL